MGACQGSRYTRVLPCRWVPLPASTVDQLHCPHREPDTIHRLVARIELSSNLRQDYVKYTALCT